MLRIDVLLKNISSSNQPVSRQNHGLAENLLVLLRIHDSVNVPSELKQLQIIMDPPPCFTVGTMFLSLKASPCFLHTHEGPLFGNNSIFVLLAHLFCYSPLKIIVFFYELPGELKAALFVAFSQ